MKVVLCCLDGENLVGSRKKMSYKQTSECQLSPRGRWGALPSALRRGGHLEAYCGLFPVGDPRKRFPDDASLRLSAILEHHSRGDGILPPKATKMSESRGENRKINTSNNISSL